VEKTQEKFKMRKVCKECIGRRKVMGLGHMLKICEKCGGVGYFEFDDVIPNGQLAAPANEVENTPCETVIEHPPKRRGRPPKAESEKKPSE
jgi:hypothetical protein